jgi:hypothetical protein
MSNGINPWLHFGKWLAYFLLSPAEEAGAERSK